MSLTITIPGAVEATTGATAPATLTVSVGTPGATGPQGPAGAGVPAGGTAGQFLTKIDGTNYNTDWTTLPAYAPLASPAFTGNPTAPTATTGDSDTSLATTAFVQQELASGTAIAKNLEVYVRNQTGSTLAAGTIVYINGATGNRPTVTPAQANSDANSAQTFGFIKTSIANNGFGYVIVRGELENVDTSSLTEGQQLYLSPSTAGTWTTTKPSAPQHLVYVGIVVRSHPTQGTILVAIQNGYELDEIHDVAIASKADNDLLAYDSATTLWKNKSFSTLGLATQSWVGSQGYLTSSSLTGYATESWVTSQGYLTSSSLTGYAQLSGATFTGEVATPASTTSSAGFSIAPGTAPTTPQNGEIWNTGSDIQVRLGGVTETLAEQSWVTAGFYPLSGNPSGFITSSALTPYAPLAGATFTGLVNTPASTTTTAGFRLPHGAAPTTPTDGDVWTTTGNLWVRISGASQAVALQGSSAQLSSNNIFTNASSTYGNSTAAGTINIGTGATVSASTRTINIGTASAAGSTNNINIGGGSGTSTTTLNGTVNATTQTAGDSTTKVATTAFVTTADNLKANLASPTFTGTPLSTTAAADTNTTQIATTAFVVGQASSTAPVVDGTATVGTSLKYARADHVHPTDTSRAALASPTFTGVPAAPTATAGTNTTQLATTAFVQSALPVMATETQAIYGTSSTTTISPLLMRYILSNPGYQTYNSLVGNYSSYVSGSGSVSTVFSNFAATQITAANGKAAFMPNNNAAYHSIFSRGKAELNMDWSKPLWFAFRFCYSSGAQLGDTNTVNRVTFGKTSSYFGDLTDKGFGVKWTAGSTGAFTVMAHNGTTLSTSASAVTISNTTYFPSTTSSADFMVYSDGAGNITLYCNNVQVATTTGGPSSGTTPGPRFVFETDNTTSTTTTVTCDYYGIRSMLAY